MFLSQIVRGLFGCCLIFAKETANEGFDDVYGNRKRWWLWISSDAGVVRSWAATVVIHCLNCNNGQFKWSKFEWSFFSNSKGISLLCSFTSHRKQKMWFFFLIWKKSQENFCKGWNEYFSVILRFAGLLLYQHALIAKRKPSNVSFLLLGRCISFVLEHFSLPF